MYGDAVVAMVEEVFAEGLEHAVLLLRHSARTFDSELHDFDNPLTDEGRALCADMGQALPKSLTLRAYASPVARCMDTAALILSAHQQAGGAITRHRPVEGLGAFYALDQMKMWRMMHEAGGLAPFVQGWFAGDCAADAMIPAPLAARLVFAVMTEKLSQPVARPQLDLCVSHDLTVHLVRHELLAEPVDGPPVTFLDGLLAWRQDGAFWMRSAHGQPQPVEVS